MEPEHHNNDIVWVNVHSSTLGPGKVKSFKFDTYTVQFIGGEIMNDVPANALSKSTKELYAEQLEKYCKELDEKIQEYDNFSKAPATVNSLYNSTMGGVRSVKRRRNSIIDKNIRELRGKLISTKKEIKELTN